MDYLDPTGTNMAWAGPLGAGIAGAGLATGQKMLQAEKTAEEHPDNEFYARRAHPTAGDYAKEAAIGAGAGLGTYYGANLLGGVLTPALGTAALPVAAVGLGAGLAYWNKKRLEEDNPDTADLEYHPDTGTYSKIPWYMRWKSYPKGPQDVQAPAYVSPEPAPEPAPRKAAATIPDWVSTPAPSRGMAPQPQAAAERSPFDVTFGFGRRRHLGIQPGKGAFNIQVGRAHG